MAGHRHSRSAYRAHVPSESGRPQYQRLTLSPSSHDFVSAVGAREVQQAVPFLDFMIDGVSLRALARDAGYGDDFATLLSPCWPRRSVDAAVHQLLSGTGAESVDMLVCSVCADRDCGAVLAHVTVLEQEVVWSHWQWVDYDPAGDRDLALPAMRFQRDPTCSCSRPLQRQRPCCRTRSLPTSGGSGPGSGGGSSRPQRVGAASEDLGPR